MKTVHWFILSRSILEYNYEEQNINVFWDEEFLYAGNYRVDIFEGGNLIGLADIYAKLIGL